MSIDLEQLEIFLRKNIETPGDIEIGWELQEINKESFIDFIMGEFGECLSKVNTKEKAENIINVIRISIYYYQLGYEKKFRKEAKDEFKRYEKSIKNKVTTIIDMLDDNFSENTQQNRLLVLLKDMENTPFKYAKINKEIPFSELNKKNLIDNITMMFSYKFNDKKCVNIIKKIFKQLPFKPSD